MTTLPHWEEAPADPAAAIREIKAALRARIASSGRSVDEVVTVAEARVRDRIEEAAEAEASGEGAWPVVDYADIEAGTVAVEVVERMRRRGCMVVRGHFDHRQAMDWDAEIVDYVERNRFFERYRGPADDFFASVESTPEIYPIYWSVPQVQARQSERTGRVRAFLNRMWRHESDGTVWFDPDRDALYPDRIRRRPPGTTSAGLGAHLDTGTLDLWMTEGYQRAFRHVFDGRIEEHDPWDAACRTDAPNYPSSTTCSAFRTFQGWTALSDMAADQGVLHSVPAPEALAYLLLRPLADDVPEDDLCGVRIGQAFPVSERWHPAVHAGRFGIPDVEAGDSVWWHCDLVHSVAAVRDQRGWGNVLYIPAAPWCPRNERYAPAVREAFLTGSSPADFPAEHYERDWDGRAGLDDLNDRGRRAMGPSDGGGTWTGAGGPR